MCLDISITRVTAKHKKRTFTTKATKSTKFAIINVRILRKLHGEKNSSNSTSLKRKPNFYHESHEKHEGEAKYDVNFDELSRNVIGCALAVHRELGPGLLESTYENCMAYELNRAKIPFRTEVNLPVQYKQIALDCGYRMDILVGDRLIVELKSVDQLLKVHEA